MAGGGEGAIVTTTVTVVPGNNLTVTVAGNGGANTSVCDVDGLGVAGGSGMGSGGNVWCDPGGSGGGASAVFDGTTPLAVAGGGGGGGQNRNGGAAGQDGAPGFPTGGQAGSETGPGRGCQGGRAQSNGIGMNGGIGYSGGGGGGGYYGGGADDGPFCSFPSSTGGGGGSSYPPAAVTGLDISATPSVTISWDFYIFTSSLPNATPGTAYGPEILQASDLGTSASPRITTVKWTGEELPKGLRLSSAGALSGVPSAKLFPGAYSVVAQATETVITLNGRKKIKTKTTVQATIPLTIT